MKKVIFVDRDGVINKEVQRSKSFTAPFNWNEFEYIEGAKEAIKRLKSFDYYIIIVTNQPHVHMGDMSLADLNHIHEQIMTELPVYDVKFCLDPGSPNYKPNPGMILGAAFQYDIDLSQSWMIGDRWKDGVAAHLAGVRYIHVGEKDPIVKPLFTVKNLFLATDIIEGFNEWGVS